MIVTWIVITLMLALVVGIVVAGVTGDGAFEFFFGFMWVVGISFWVALIFVAGHFIGKYW
jgi:hypothetical protein